MEETLYSDGAVTVTTTRFVTGATTYAMAQITSVTAIVSTDGARVQKIADALTQAIVNRR